MKRLTELTAMTVWARRRQPVRVPPPARCAGFSLIELLVVLAIVVVLSAIALPNYSQHLQRGNRAEAVAALLEAQQFMERYYSVNGRYSLSAGGNDAPQLPLRLQNIPSGAVVRYELSVASAAVNAYALQAAPVGAMAGDKCGTLTLTQTGQKGLTDSQLSAAECWR